MFKVHSPLKILRRRWKVVLIFGLVFALISVFITVLFPLEYRADAQVLIISKSRYGVDPYTVVKSAERIGENIAQVIKTDDFYNKVVGQSDYVFDNSKFENISERKKRKRWQKTVDASVVYGTGVLNISSYSENSDDAKKMAGAVASTLASKGWEYVGGDVSIKVVNDPIVTKWPARPNLVLNLILGFMVGVLVSGFVLVRK